MATQPLRLLMLSHVARNPDTAAVTSLRLASSLRDEGHEVTMLFLEDFMPRRWDSTGPMREDLAAIAALQFVRETRRRDFDVIDATSFLGVWLFPALRQRRGRPLLVARSYGLEHFDRDALMKEAAIGHASVSVKYRIRRGFLHLRALESAVRASDGFICPTRSAATRVLAAGWKHDPRQVSVTGFGITPEALRPTRDPQKPWEGRVVWCGTTNWRKGWRYFVEGMTTAMRDQHLELEVLGTRRDAPSILDEFPGDLRDRIRVHGTLKRSEQFETMARGDVFVSTSLSEGYHLALQEAMALGLPCIATREGFLVDAAAPGNLYLEIPKSSSSALTKAIARLAKDDPYRHHLASTARGFGRDMTWGWVASRTAEWMRARLALLPRARL
jgi:glycosyltransferase involved in cell wall biosynthesis